MKSFGEACHEVAVKHGLGQTLVTGHKASYFQEAAQIMLQSVSPSEDKTAEQEEMFIRDRIVRIISHNKDDLGRTIISGLVQDFYNYLQYHRTLCRNKAIEEAVKVATENGTVRIDLVSTLNKLKA